MFIKPMLASPIKNNVIDAGWVAEEKYDGHRLCITINDGDVEAITRIQNRRELPPHVIRDLQRLPNGVYDGELISTKKTKAYGVTDLEQADHLQFVIFDLLQLPIDPGRLPDTTYLEYSSRRMLLEEIFTNVRPACTHGRGIELSRVWKIEKRSDVNDIAESVWARGGEGLILKKTSSLYEVGKRSKQWLKIKQSHTSALTVIGFVAGLLGPHATVLLEDNRGNHVTVKTLDTHERERIAKHPDSFIGRKLRIEFQERTPDGGYRHPMWDRWEDE
jgi:ATP-dependent DNA ligase